MSKKNKNLSEFVEYILLEQIRKLKAEGGDGLQKLLDKDFANNKHKCPCFSVEFLYKGEKQQVRGKNAQDLHFFGNKELAKEIKECLDKTL